jgi:hypothetical protein
LQIGSSIQQPTKSWAGVSAPIQKPLTKPVKGFITRFGDLFKEELDKTEVAAQTALPYYADLRTNTFSVLQTESGDVKETGYNIGLTAFLQHTTTGDVAFFKDDGITLEAEPVLREVAVYVHKLNKGALDWRVETTTKPSSQLFKLANMIVANLYWEDVTEKPHLLVPPAVVDSVLRSKTPPKKGSHVTYEDLFRKEIGKYNTGPLKVQMGNAFLHLIKQAYLSGTKEMRTKWAYHNMIQAHKKFTPSFSMLKVNGLVVDVKIGQYKDLFRPTEWEIIYPDSALARAEKDLARLMKKSFSYDTLPGFVKELENLMDAVGKDPLASTVKQTRRSRLRFAGELKSASKRKATFSLGYEVSTNLHNDKIREAFNPFRIHFVAGRITVPPSELLPFICWDEKDKIYRWTLKRPDVTSKSDEVIASVALEFVEWLNK